MKVKKHHKKIYIMGYSVGIVGASGAVGKEIISVLEKSQDFPIDKLRLFGSSRSAGTKGAGDVEIELFSVAAARECDVIFLAVSGDFAKEHARDICEGDDGAVVIDNSVRFPSIKLSKCNEKC